MLRALTFSIICYSFWGIAATETVSPPRTDSVKNAAGGNEEALRILTMRCTGCHQSDSPPGDGFLSLEKLSEKSTLELLNAVIRKSKMPKPHRDFKNTKDGKKLLKWIDARLK